MLFAALRYPADVFKSLKSCCILGGFRRKAGHHYQSFSNGQFPFKKTDRQRFWKIFEKHLLALYQRERGVLQNAHCFGIYSIKKVQKKIEVTLYCSVVQDTFKLPQQMMIFQVFYDSQQFPFKGERRQSGEMAPLVLWLARVSI